MCLAKHENGQAVYLIENINPLQDSNKYMHRLNMLNREF